MSSRLKTIEWSEVFLKTTSGTPCNQVCSQVCKQPSLQADTIFVLLKRSPRTHLAKTRVDVMRERPVGKDAAPLAGFTSRRLQRLHYSRKDKRRDSRKRLQRRRRLNLKLASDACHRLSIAGCRVEVSGGWKHYIVRFQIFKKWQTNIM